MKRLKVEGLSDACLETEIEAGLATRAAEFATCRYCGRRVAAEHRISSDVCHGCASEHEGVVF